MGSGQSLKPIAMKIALNGDPFEIDEPMTVTRFLDHLRIDPRRVAVEHNLVIVPRSRYADTSLSEGDRLEIVHFVGGG